MSDPARKVDQLLLQLEHEHADHPDYVFAVDAESSDPVERSPEGHVLFWNKSSHALIYTDGTIALTLYECCYHTWLLSLDGKLLHGTLLDNTWRLTVPSVEKILTWHRERATRTFPLTAPRDSG